VYFNFNVAAHNDDDMLLIITSTSDEL